MVSAGGKLRLEGEKNVVFSLCYWENVLAKKKNHNKKKTQYKKPSRCSGERFGFSHVKTVIFCDC